MTDNPCLRAACLSDIPRLWRKRNKRDWGCLGRWLALEKLYRHEWRLRGYRWAP